MIGAGRLGCSLALALRSQGAHLAGFTAGTPEGRARAEVWLGQPAAADMGALASRSPHLYLIATPDDALAAVARELGKELGQAAASGDTGSMWADGAPATPGLVAPLVAHTSGATSVAVLSPCEEAGAATFVFHPLQTFADPASGASRFAGAAVAVTPSVRVQTTPEGGASPSAAFYDPSGAEAQRAAEALPAAVFGFGLARALGARPFLLQDDKRTLYHAAATVACNYLVTLEHHAERLFVEAGLDEREALALFLPLVTATLDNLREQGSVAALTGPLSRGDTRTIAGHLRALANGAPHLLPLYRVLGLATLEMVRARADIHPAVIGDMANILTAFASPPEQEPTEQGA